MASNQDDQTQMQFVISKNVKIFLKHYAIAGNVSTSELVRAALQEYFDKRGEQIDMHEGIGEWGRRGL